MAGRVHEERDEAPRYPSQISFDGWQSIARRVWGKIGENRVLLVAAGVTFYLLLALFPGLAAFVSIYGLFSDPSTVTEQVEAMSSFLPAGGTEIIQNRLESLTQQTSGALSFGLIAGLLVSFWGANNGVKAIFDALNIAYEEEEKRSFLMLNLQAFVFTIGAMLALVILIAVVGVLPVVLQVIDLGGLASVLLDLGRWALLLVLIGGGITLLYRYGPSREPARWRWITWGSVFATLVWLAASAGFSYYLQNFANYEAVYGSLGAVIGFLIWIWISVTILIIGAEINAAMEKLTSVDSTTGEPEPIGQRGAAAADHHT